MFKNIWTPQVVIYNRKIHTHKYMHLQRDLDQIYKWAEELSVQFNAENFEALWYQHAKVNAMPIRYVEFWGDCNPRHRVGARPGYLLRWQWNAGGWSAGILVLLKREIRKPWWYSGGHLSKLLCLLFPYIITIQCKINCRIRGNSKKLHEEDRPYTIYKILGKTQEIETLFSGV